VAKGGEKYITIGKFHDEKIKLRLITKFRWAQLYEKKKEKFIVKHADILPINPLYNNKLNYYVEAPYYFIDDVSVELDTTI